MGMFDPMWEQIVFQFATDHMYADNVGGESGAPTGYYGIMSIADVSEARDLIRDWTETLDGGRLVLDAKPAELVGYWQCWGDSYGFHYVTRAESDAAMLEWFESEEAVYSAWLDQDENDV
jgi:hypothetical protein